MTQKFPDHKVRHLLSSILYSPSSILYPVREPPLATLAVMAAYFLLTISMTWPAMLHLAGAIPGDGFDGWQNYWNLWWVKQALLVEQTDPFFSHYLYPPHGVSLLFHTLNIFNGLWTLPIQLNFGLAVAYHSVVFLSFGLAGYGGYLLSLYTLARAFPAARSLRLAAFTGGVVFTMSPFHLAHLLGHMQVFSMIWPPFYILWLLRTLESWSRSSSIPARGRWREVAVSTLFLTLAGLVDWYHVLYLLIFTGLALLWTLWRRRHTAAWASLLRPIWPVLAIGLGFGAILSPLLMSMIRQATARADLETGLFQNITLSADLLAFILPSEMHPLWGEWAKSMADNFSSTTSERLVFAGYIPLVLTSFIIIRRWASPVIKFWTFVLLVFFILALGPYLHISGQIVALGSWQIPMPYLLLYKTVPLLNLTRSLSRYDLMIMLSLGLLTAAAIAQLTISHDQLTKTENHTPMLTLPVRRATYYALLTTHYVLPFIPLLICFEFLAIPYPLSKIEIPRFYFDIGAQPDRYAIAELPMNWDRPTPLLHQTVHGKPLLTAYTSRHNPLELAWRTPVLQHWRYLGPDIIDQPLEQVAPTIFYDFNLRYIVLDYWQMPPGPERTETERWVAAALPAGLAPIYDDGRLIVYQTPPRQAIHPYLSLGDGWGARQTDEDGTISRAMIANPDCQTELFLHHPQQRALSLEITAAARDASNSVHVFAGDQPINDFEVTTTFSSYIINLPAFANDLVKLSFCPGALTDTITVRRLSLAIVQE